MTNSIKTDVINSLVAISYYWMGEDNPQAALSIIKLLYKIDLTTIQGKKVDDLYSDFKTFFKDKFDETNFTNIEIPKNYKTDENKLMYIAGITILNMFSSGNFEVGYNQLIDMSVNWNELYIYVINSLKNQKFKNEITDWLLGHVYMAYDLIGEKDMLALGYKITKLD